MSIQDFTSFKERFKLSDNFITITNSLFEKLVYFGYISNRDRKRLIDKLSLNVDDIHIGTKNGYDYKSGYYDANNKIIYIKDENDIPAIYLRLLYAISTIEISKNIFYSGYSIVKMRSDSYKLEYSNFGINRAVMANLVCKLCDTLPINIGITATYKTYTHDFLGYTITANNDIYSLEGKLLSELCYVLNVDENVFYAGIFQNDPLKYLNSIFIKKGFNNDSIKKLLGILDKISITYNKYNKVLYLSKLLNDNYLEIKKNILNNNIDKLSREKKHIENELFKVIDNILTSEANSSSEIDDTNPRVSEATDILEETLKFDITSFQDILADKIITLLSILSPYVYASKLQQFYNMLIWPSKKIKEKIRDIILYDLIPSDELMATNIIQKMRYSIILDLLSNEKFTNISNNFSFYSIQDLIDELDGTALIIVSANKSFARMLQINGLNNKLDDMKIEINYIPLDNLKYIMNSDFSNMYINDIEKLYTYITTKFELFNNISLENMYIFEYLDKKYVILYKEGKPYIASIDMKKTTYSVKFLDVSDNFKVFESYKNIRNESNKLLPTISKRKIV